MKKVNVGPYIAYIICLHLFLLLIMVVYRIILIQHFQEFSLPTVNECPEIGFELMTILQGLWRDNIFILLASMLSFFIVLGSKFLKIPNPNRLLICIKTFYWLIFIIFIIICAINIPYYIEFCKPFDLIAMTAMKGSNGSAIVKMIIDDPVYCKTVVLSLIIVSGLSVLIIRYPKNLFSVFSARNMLPSHCLSFALCFVLYP